MKKYLPVISLISSLVAISIGLYIWHRLNLALLEIESHNCNLVESQVGMDWIVGIMNSNFGILITFVTVLFGMFSIITFVSISEKSKLSIRKLTKRFEKERDESVVHKNYIKSIEGDLSFEIADKNYHRLNELFDKTDREYDDYVRIVELSLTTCEYFSKSLLLKTDVYPKFDKSVRGLIKSILSDASDLISIQDKFELTNMGYERFLRLQRTIEQIADLDDKQNLSSIFSKLDFPTLD